MTARITILESLPIPAWSDEVVRMLAISSPPASPLSPWSSSPPQIPFPLPPLITSPPLPLSPPSPVLSAPPPSPIRLLGYQAVMIQIRAEAAATSHSLPLPPPFILSSTRLDAPPPMPTSALTSLPPSAALAACDATRNGIDSHTSGTGVRGSERVAREYTYQNFMKCKPLYFKGTEGVVELTQWFERMETV
ncbi:hypothetical protein Tco_0023002 [Tanacetum coccineum]